MKIEWSEKFKIDITLFDVQHQRLFQIFNRLYDLKHSENTTHAELNHELKGLQDYTQTHFVSEEEFMRIYGYPQFEAHKRAHDTFRNYVETMTSDHSSGHLTLMDSTINFLQKWLIEHIGVTDRKMSEFFTEKKLHF